MDSAEGGGASPKQASLTASLPAPPPWASLRLSASCAATRSGARARYGAPATGEAAQRCGNAEKTSPRAADGALSDWTTARGALWPTLLHRPASSASGCQPEPGARGRSAGAWCRGRHCRGHNLDGSFARPGGAGPYRVTVRSALAPQSPGFLGWTRAPRSQCCGPGPTPAVVARPLCVGCLARADMSNIAHYCKYAEAIYGWPLYLNADLFRVTKVWGRGAHSASEQRVHALD